MSVFPQELDRSDRGLRREFRDAFGYLLDTNVLSELRRKAPDQRVVEWVAARPPSTLYLSVLPLGKIRKGIHALPDRKRRPELVDWLEADLPAFFSGRVLAIDERVSPTVGVVCSPWPDARFWTSTACSRPLHRATIS